MKEDNKPGVRYKGLPEQSKRRACEEHSIWYVKSASGVFYCPVCAAENRMKEEKTIYLAGSVEAIKDSRTWRQRIKQDYPNVDWISPHDGPHTWEDDKTEAFMWCKQQILRSDGILIRYKRGEETWGTPSEMIWAWEAGIPVFVWQFNPHTDIPNFLRVTAEVIDARLDYIIKEDIK